MLTFLHLSDIHFRNRSTGDQFDLEAQLRRSMLNDIVSKPANGADYDGLLITGDIAFSGKKEEYDRAKSWLDEIYSMAAVPPENSYVIPGNHDVNRDMVVKNGAIWNNHAVLRNAENRIKRQETLQTQLVSDPACDPLATLAGFNEFAQGYECRTAKNNLAWFHVFPKPLDDGSELRITGLNSALNSDSGDLIANLYVSPFQTSHLSDESGVINMVLCHHPPNWLLDQNDIEGILNRFVKVALFGHEHSHRSRIVNDTVELFAGAVHPVARDPDWLPTYHILQLEITGTGKERKLVVRIHSREFRNYDHVFVRRSAAGGKDFEEYRINLKEWNRPVPVVIPIAPAPISGVSSGSAKMTVTSQPASTPPMVLRELLVHFHRLSTPVRFKIVTKLGLLRDRDDFPPQQLWDLVFKRAREENRLSEMWDEIAKIDTSFAKRPNPFIKP